MIHRDVKPDNVMYVKDGETGWILKVGDFDLSIISGANDKTTRQTVSGTPCFVPPEIRWQAKNMKTGREKAEYSKKVDVWASTLTLFDVMSVNGWSASQSCRTLRNHVPWFRADMPWTGGEAELAKLWTNRREEHQSARLHMLESAGSDRLATWYDFGFISTSLEESSFQPVWRLLAFGVETEPDERKTAAEMSTLFTAAGRVVSLFSGGEEGEGEGEG